MTTREGGISEAPFDRLNLRSGLGDDPLAVEHNHAVLRAAMGAVPVWLHQVHGARVVRLRPEDGRIDAAHPEADASVSTVPGLACVVQVADCLPVLLAAGATAKRPAVAAAHAGWRGLARGVVESTLAALCEAATCEPNQVDAWLGACIGPRQFEVGADVLQAFGVDPSADFNSNPGPQARFAPRGADRPGKWLADLAGLARDRLEAAGVYRIRAAQACTVEDGSRFFSFRRDGVTGRMAAAIWIER